MRKLGNKLGPLLVQTPPSLESDRRIASEFFSALREHHPGDIGCEPRHLSWLTPTVNQFFIEHRIARAAVDPWQMREQSEPGGWNGLVYYRLHGSPEIYKSAYTADYLQALAPKLVNAASSAPVWCVFDNPGAYAVQHGLDLMELIKRQRN